MKVRYLFLTVVLFIGITGLTACQVELPDPLPDNPIVYRTGALYTDNGTAYVTIENDNKVYLIYGEIKGKGLSKEIHYAFGECLGYIDGDRSTLIYSLVNESTDEWLIECYQSYFNDEVILTATVIREISTKGNDRIPDCVLSLGYDYWK